MILDTRYKNYWLDMDRKEKDDKENERKKSIGAILAMLQQFPKLRNKIKKP